MKLTTIFEFDHLVEKKIGAVGQDVPTPVFVWLKAQCLINDGSTTGWLKLAQYKNQSSIQVKSYVGVIRAPCGYQIEVLPKIGKASSKEQARTLLIDMLRCMVGFRHIKTTDSDLTAARMPILEVFIQQFLLAVSSLVKRGVRGDYVARQDNLFALRGKLLMGNHISQNLIRRDRFFTEHDEFSQNRAENRLIHTALRRILALCKSQQSQRFARELAFVFAEVPLSTDIAFDIQHIRVDRGMKHYAAALDWAKMILQNLSPMPGVGKHHAPSLLFPMEALFESFVAKHLAQQLQKEFSLKTQASSQYLVTHNQQPWFRMKPDLLIKHKQRTRLVLDTKWKLLDAAKNNGREKYLLNQADFYQLYAYGHHYLNGIGDIVLIYPKSDTFTDPLPRFDFPNTNGMRLWVLPFCLKDRNLKLPGLSELGSVFNDGAAINRPNAH